MRYNARQTSHSGWSLIKTIVFFLAIACAGWLLFQRTVQNQLSHKVQDRVDQLLAGTDINASIQHASFVDGQGLKLRNVSVGTNATGSSLSSLNSSTSVIEIYEAFVRSPVSLPQLVAGNMPIQSVEIRRARLNLMKDTTGTWNIESLIHALQNLKTSGETNVPVILRDCQIELVDLSDPDAHRQVRVSNLTLSVMPIDHQGHQLTQVNGQFVIYENPAPQELVLSSTDAPYIEVQADPMIFVSNNVDCVNGDVSVNASADNVCQDGLIWSFQITDNGGTVWASGSINQFEGSLVAAQYNIVWTATTACGVSSNLTQALIVENTFPF